MSQNKMVTKSDLQDFYNGIYPYLNGAAHAGFTPVGTIISVMGNTAPVNYLVCDGTIYNIADYPILANYFEEQFEASNFFGGDGITTLAVPDLRGEFLRGTGTNGHSNQGDGPAVGTHQDASSIRHWHTDGQNVVLRVANKYTTQAVVQDNDGSVNPMEATSFSNLKVSATTATTSATGTSYNVRPTNTSVLYCIATKNIYIDARCSYSTNEQVIGTWIDGKPLYQKTIQITVPATNKGSTTQVDVDTDSTHKLIRAWGLDTNGLEPDSGIDLSGASYTNLHFIYNDASTQTGCKLHYRVSNIASNMSAFNATVTIQYTKTTD